MPAACTATRSDGAACAAPALPGSSWCWAHDPDRTEQRQRARQAGGRGRSTVNRSAKHLPAHLRDVQTALIELVADVRAGRAEPQQGTAVAAIVGRLVELTRLSAELGDQHDIEQRLTALEQRVVPGRIPWQRQHV